jgi:hypothetical protein
MANAEEVELGRRRDRIIADLTYGLEDLSLC